MFTSFSNAALTCGVLSISDNRSSRPRVCAAKFEVLRAVFCSKFCVEFGIFLGRPSLGHLLEGS